MCASPFAIGAGLFTSLSFPLVSGRGSDTDLDESPECVLLGELECFTLCAVTFLTILAPTNLDDELARLNPSGLSSSVSASDEVDSVRSITPCPLPFAFPFACVGGLSVSSEALGELDPYTPSCVILS